jgi:hypothetical protein
MEEMRLAARMPELSNQASPFAFDCIRGTLKPLVVLALPRGGCRRVGPPRLVL